MFFLPISIMLWTSLGIEIELLPFWLFPTKIPLAVIYKKNEEKRWKLMDCSNQSPIAQTRSQSGWCRRDNWGLVKVTYGDWILLVWLGSFVPSVYTTGGGMPPKYERTHKQKTFNLIPYVKAYDILRKSFHIWIYWIVHNKTQVFSARINLFGSGFWLWRAEYNQIVRNFVIDYIWSNKQLAWIFILRYMTPLWMGASLTRMCILNCINWLMNNHINWIGHLDEEFTLFYIERLWKLRR